MEAGLSGDMHPRIDGVPTHSIFSSDLGNLTAGPGFLDNGELDLWGGMILRHRGIYRITKRGVCQEKSVC